MKYSHLTYDLILEPIEEIKFTPDYKANEPIFRHGFKDLSKNINGLSVIYLIFTP
jgi:hypothetical protein